MGTGPFNPDIMPVKAEYRYDDVKLKWIVKVSRLIRINVTGARREVARESFDNYGAAISFVSVFFGNV
jgi:hypothetical protein